jgi:hypothetical protein
MRSFLTRLMTLRVDMMNLAVVVDSLRSPCRLLKRASNIF